MSAKVAMGCVALVGGKMVGLGLGISLCRLYLISKKVKITDVLKNDKRHFFSRIQRAHGNLSEWAGVTIGIILAHYTVANGQCPQDVEYGIAAMTAGKMAHSFGMIIPTSGIEKPNPMKSVGMGIFYIALIHLSVRLGQIALAK